MAYVVQWDQWYRCGKYGDDKDFETMTMEFGTLCEAQKFKDDLASGLIHRGFADMKVRPEEVEIFSK